LASASQLEADNDEDWLVVGDAQENVGCLLSHCMLFFM
jgi:hypothetical protein